MLVIIAVLAGVTLLNSFNNQAREREEEAARQAEIDRKESMKAEAIQNLGATQAYQKYCVKGVARIDTAGDYSKIVYGTAQKTITYYDAEGKRVYCTEGAAKPSEACASIAALAFETAYVCTGVNISSMLSGGNGLQVRTQTAGNAVVVDTALLESPGFIVIHKKTGSKPGAILAQSQLLPAGASEIISIAMPEALTTWETYIAMLHTDNGDSEFNAEEDASILNEGGDKMIMVEFTAVKGD